MSDRIPIAFVNFFTSYSTQMPKESTKILWLNQHDSWSPRFDKLGVLRQEKTMISLEVLQNLSNIDEKCQRGFTWSLPPSFTPYCTRIPRPRNNLLSQNHCGLGSYCLGKHCDQDKERQPLP